MSSLLSFTERESARKSLIRDDHIVRLKKMTPLRFLKPNLAFSACPIIGGMSNVEAGGELSRSPAGHNRDPVSDSR